MPHLRLPLQTLLKRPGRTVFIVAARDGNAVAVVKSVASLLEREALVVGPLAKVRRRLPAAALLCNVVEERLVAAVDALYNILDGLAAEAVPRSISLLLFELCDVFLQRVCRQAFAVQFIVASVHSDTVIPDGGRYVDLRIEMLVLFAVVEFVLVGFHDRHSSLLLSSRFLRFNILLDCRIADIAGGRYKVTASPKILHP